MWKFFVAEKIKIFFRGFVPGAIAGFTFLFGSSFAKGNVVFIFFAKLFATSVLAFASGLATVIAHDAWKYWLKPKWQRFKKRYQNRKIKRNDQRGNSKAA